jgi:hypothetical protein
MICVELTMCNWHEQFLIVKQPENKNDKKEQSYLEQLKELCTKKLYMYFKKFYHRSKTS